MERHFVFVYLTEEPKVETKTEKTEPPVTVTFKGDTSIKRRLARFGEDVLKNENTRPSFNKLIKRERQIYVPPTSKKEGRLPHSFDSL